MGDDSLIELADRLTKIIETATGHREKCIAAGFSPAAAEQMATEVHQFLLSALIRRAKGSR